VHAIDVDICPSSDHANLSNLADGDRRLPAVGFGSGDAPIR
jgi:hypothetical protein